MPVTYPGPDIGSLTAWASSQVGPAAQRQQRCGAALVTREARPGAVGGPSSTPALLVPRWPIHSVEEPLASFERIGWWHAIGSLVPSIVGVALIASVCLESVWLLCAISALGTVLLLGMRRTRALQARAREHAVAALRDRCERRRAEHIARLTPSDRARLERLECMVEHIRRIAMDEAQPLDAMLVERFDLVLHYYVRVAIDRQRTEAAYKLVSNDAAHSSGQSREDEQLRHISALRSEARASCEERLHSAGTVLQTLAEVVSLGYEQCLARSLVLQDVVDHIDEVLDDVSHMGAARIEADATVGDLRSAG